MESRKSSRKPAPTCPSKCLQVYSWNCCLAGMPRKFEETPATHPFRDASSRRVLASTGDYAAQPGSCRKPPGARYTERGKEKGTLLGLFARGDHARLSLRPN